MSIADKITPLHDRVEVAIFFGRGFTSSDKLWSVNIKLRDGDARVEVDKRAASLEDALIAAWDEIERVTYTGLSNGTLSPPVDVPKIPLAKELDDEIPF